LNGETVSEIVQVRAIPLRLHLGADLTDESGEGSLDAVITEPGADSRDEKAARLAGWPELIAVSDVVFESGDGARVHQHDPIPIELQIAVRELLAVNLNVVTIQGSDLAYAHAPATSSRPIAVL
jgi:hypothetical protein